MLKIYTDGLVEPTNPGGHGVWAWVAITSNGHEIASASGYLGQKPGMTNNYAEYYGIGQALRWALDNGHQGFALFSDSQVAIQQINEKYACNSERLLPLLTRVKELAEATRAQCIWIPRANNKRADELTRMKYQHVTGQQPPERRKA